MRTSNSRTPKRPPSPEPHTLRGRREAEQRPPEAHANPLVQALGKLPEDFTRKDLLGLIKKRGIRSVHFRYPGGDGKLKELKLPINDLNDIDAVLADGERVDGSSLFKGMVDPGSSDMYVVPVYRTAYLSPFVPDCLEFVCRFLDNKAEPALLTPDNVLARSDEAFRSKTGMELHALGELEFYLIYPDEQNLYPGRTQGFYHEAAPYARWDGLAEDILRHTSQICGGVKYVHSEVGYISASTADLPEVQGKRMCQVELEFLPAPVQETAARLLVAKWIIRNLAARQGVLVTFAPKLSLGDAGSGLHFHLRVTRKGANVMTEKNGDLSETAHSTIGGLLQAAPSLTAFGNTCAASYLRLVPHQEAPVRVCWSAANRSALVRVPLGWRGVRNLATRVNPKQPADFDGDEFGQTVELRSPDGSADIYLLLAGMAAAVRYGLTHGDESLKAALECKVDRNIFNDPKACARLKPLPRSCWESARALETDRARYAADGVFPAATLDYCVRRLDAEQDKDLASGLAEMGPEQKTETLMRLVRSSLHCM
ncbi:MAG: glutamine synthetase family protein [Elusimicrobiota bacterium]